MGITLFNFGALPAPLHALMGWLAGSSSGRRSSCAPPSVAAARPCQERPRRPVRVVRVIEASQPPAAGAGRMLISGRMSDVCAELDRLAALEAAAG